ncbi:MAG: ATP-binding protein [Armatimonadetes bacterium]|nr:ATP-binding protein [Armatimonadota bacterium]
MSTPGSGRSRILVVSADGAAIEAVSRALAGLEAEISAVTDPSEGAELLQAGTHDAAVVVLYGASDERALLERFVAANIPVVALADDADWSWRVEAFRRGVFDCLPMPFAHEELSARVERAIRWKNLTAAAREGASRAQWLQAIVNGVEDGVLVTDAEGRLILTNAAACQAFGLGAAACYLRPLEDVIRDPNLLRLIKHASAGGQDSLLPVTAHTVLSGRTYLARILPLGTADGQAFGAALILRDVTEHVAIEEAKSWFTSKVAHELKAPLAAALGYIRAVLARADMPREQIDGILTRCAERLEGMAALVRDLLDLARAETAGGRHMEALALKDLISEVVYNHSPLAERSRVIIEVEVPDDLPPLQADRDDMTVLLNNLVSNAIKYNRPGGKVILRAYQQGDWLHVEVADTGLGIPADLIPRLGQEFFRIKSPDRRHIVGTGLGMSLVKRTVEAYHGRLDISSKEGEGSVFTVWLPLSPPDAGLTQAPLPWDLTP